VNGSFVGENSGGQLIATDARVQGTTRYVDLGKKGNHIIFYVKKRGII